MCVLFRRVCVYSGDNKEDESPGGCDAQRLFAIWPIEGVRRPVLDWGSPPYGRLASPIQLRKIELGGLHVAAAIGARWLDIR